MDAASSNPDDAVRRWRRKHEYCSVRRVRIERAEAEDGSWQEGTTRWAIVQSRARPRWAPATIGYERTITRAYATKQARRPLGAMRAVRDPPSTPSKPGPVGSHSNPLQAQGCMADNNNAADYYYLQRDPSWAGCHGPMRVC